MLQVLPQNISNLIAAGEVVTRPASVVKELVENAVDAGARSVIVSVLDAGKTLIQVIDDGCGMTPEEAVLCFERHATSKIATAEDLQRILTYGFRGEALASIAAVSEVTLRTRREDDEVGVQVEISESKPPRTQPVAAPKGSNFAVRNLFFNVPARRKFLKSDNAELRAIIQEFQRVALIRPEVAFKLTSNGKEIHNLKPATTLKKRILDIFGMTLPRNWWKSRSIRAWSASAAISATPKMPARAAAASFSSSTDAISARLFSTRPSASLMRSWCLTTIPRPTSSSWKRSRSAWT